MTVIKQPSTEFSSYALLEQSYFHDKSSAELLERTARGLLTTDPLHRTESGARELERLLALPVDASDLLADLVPPRHFESASFANYHPDPAYPSQLEASKVLRQCIEGLQRRSEASGFSRLLRSVKHTHGTGIYLDGGFGVGKTHLLASCFHAFEGPRAYMSFQELMFLVGLIKLEGVVQQFRGFRLLVIDEFELDDPANTRIATNLLGQLFDAGLTIITSSNTPPGVLGEGKFSLDQFRRELGDLARRFTSLRVEGEDYRITHRPANSEVTTWFRHSDHEFDQNRLALSGKFGESYLDIEFERLLAILSIAHPIRVRKAISQFSAISVGGVKTLIHPYEALRLVYLIDKLYDNNAQVCFSANVSIERLFHETLLVGGDTKKYLRTRSRLEEMTSL